MVRVPIEVESMAKIISAPICVNGIKDENIRAPNPMFEQTSNRMGYPTLFITSKFVFSILELFFMQRMKSEM